MSDFQTKFYLNFIKDDRWKYITSGLGNTLKITVFALIFAVIIGVLVAIIRYSYDKTTQIRLVTLFSLYFNSCLLLPTVFATFI